MAGSNYSDEFDEDDDSNSASHSSKSSSEDSDQSESFARSHQSSKSADKKQRPQTAGPRLASASLVPYQYQKDPALRIRSAYRARMGFEPSNLDTLVTFWNQNKARLDLEEITEEEIKHRLMELEKKRLEEIESLVRKSKLGSPDKKKAETPRKLDKDEIEKIVDRLAQPKRSRTIGHLLEEMPLATNDPIMKKILKNDKRANRAEYLADKRKSKEFHRKDSDDSASEPENEQTDDSRKPKLFQGFWCPVGRADRAIDSSYNKTVTRRLKRATRVKYSYTPAPAKDDSLWAEQFPEKPLIFSREEDQKECTFQPRISRYSDELVPSDSGAATTRGQKKAEKQGKLRRAELLVAKQKYDEALTLLEEAIEIVVSADSEAGVQLNNSVRDLHKNVKKMIRKAARKKGWATSTEIEGKLARRALRGPRKKKKSVGEYE